MHATYMLQHASDIHVTCTCNMHATYLQHACRHAAYLQHLCNIQATCMRYTCSMHTTYMLSLCNIHLRTYNIHATYMQHACKHACSIHAAYMLHTGRFAGSNVLSRTAPGLSNLLSLQTMHTAYWLAALTPSLRGSVPSAFAIAPGAKQRRYASMHAACQNSRCLGPGPNESCALHGNHWRNSLDTALPTAPNCPLVQKRAAAAAAAAAGGSGLFEVRGEGGYRLNELEVNRADVAPGQPIHGSYMHRAMS